MDVEVEDVDDKALVDDGPIIVDMQSLRIEQDSGSSFFNDDIGIGVAAHPLCLPVVSSCLFDFLDVAGLKNARLVCKDWADAGNSKLIKRATLLVHGDKNLDSFATILGQTSKNRFRKYRFENVPVSEFNSIFNSTGQHIKTFLLGENYASYPNFEYKVEFLRSIFLECPNLEELNLFCSDEDFMFNIGKLWEPNLAFKLKKVTLSVSAESGINSDVLMELINACPDLRSFNLLSNRDDFPHAYQLIQLGASGKVNLEKLDEFNFGSNFPLTNYTVRLFRAQKLSLSKLKLKISWGAVNQASMSEMLHHLSGTLTSFTCEISKESVEFPVIFPANMTKLATIEITTDKNLHFIDPIISASRLPNLNTLLLFTTPGNCNYIQTAGVTDPESPDFGTCWRQRQSELYVTNRCPSLNTLQIPGGLTSGNFFGDMTAVFSNVTDLRLQNPSAEVVAAVFAKYSNLERLSIKMDRFPPIHKPDPQDGFVGLRPRPSWFYSMRERQNFEFFNPSQNTQIWAGLKDMKNLKYFELRQLELSPFLPYEAASSNQLARITKLGDSYLSDVSLLQGLWYLTTAVQIDVRGRHQLSKEAIEDLKSALGPCCFVNILPKTGRERDN